MQQQELLMEESINNEDSIRKQPVYKKSSLIPEALPLFSLPTQSAMLEPEVKFKMNRMYINRKTTFDVSNQNKRQGCRHLTVKDYKCQECNQFIASFKGSMFDTGGITTYLNIKYVNEFVDNFESNNNGMTLGRPKVIYENYKPKNVYDMREFILYTIDKSLTKALKRDSITDDHLKVFGKPGSGKNLSAELISYMIFKKNRERRILCRTEEKVLHDQENGDEEKKKDETPYSAIGPHCLLFDSFFECGNLEKAEYVNPTEYNLYLNVDTNTKGHQQWFYFKVKNTFKDKQYTFHIRNFTKPFSLHRSGMKILMKSKKRCLKEETVNQDSPENWIPIGEEMCYWRTDIQRSGWRVPGALNLDDEEDADEVMDDLNILDGVVPLSGPDNNAKKLSTQGTQNKIKPPQQLGGLNRQNSQVGISQSQTVKRKRRYFYCLTFKVEFEFDDDKVYFAYSRPYPYSKIYTEVVNTELTIMKLQKANSKDIKVVDSSDHTERIITTKEIFYQRQLLGKTLSGLPVPVISITSRKNKGLEYRKRQGICITARVHPGETNSNFVYDGILKFLLSPEGIYNLLQNYVFKLIPCLNPDGNVCGNYRSSLAGVDLNRQWIYPNKDIHPVIFRAKEMMAQFSKERNFLVYCDLHCHSKKKNSFIYGCNTAANGGFTSWTKTRLLPRIFARQTPIFNFKDCRFRIDPDKLGTARVIVWREFGVTNSFTLENSFYGYQLGEDTIPFKTDHYYLIGENLMRSLIEYRLCLKQIEKELQISNGWLKPKLLIEVTGTPAAQRIAEEQAQQRRKALKQKKMELYMQNLGLVEKRPISPLIRQKGIGVEAENNQESGQKTRNRQKTNTNAVQQVIQTPKTEEGHSSQERLNKNPFKRQQTNRSDSKLQLIKTIQNGDKRQSSSDSTNDFSNKKLNNLTSNSISGNQGRNIEVGVAQAAGAQNKSSLISKGRQIKRQVSRKHSMKSGGGGSGHGSPQPRSESRDSLSDSMNGAPGKMPAKMSSKKLTNSNHKRNTSNTKNSPTKQKTIKKEKTRSSSVSVEDFAKDWRAYFLGEELEEIYEQIEEGEDPNDFEDQLSMSDDCASDDYLDVNDLYQDVYMRGSLMEMEVLQAKNAEEAYSQQIKKEIQSAQAARKKIPLETQQKNAEEEYLESDEDSLKSDGKFNQAEQESILNVSVADGGIKAVVNKVNSLTSGQEPLQIQSLKAKLNTPVLGDKKDNKLIQQILKQKVQEELSLRYQQVLDTSQQQSNFFQSNIAEPAYTFINQQQYAHLDAPGKIKYRKSNLDLMANQGAKNQHNNHYLLHSSLAPVDHSLDPLSKYRQSFNSSSGKYMQAKQYNGFQQYIQHSIKNEKQIIQQAYQKLNNHQANIQKPSNQAKIKSNLMNHSFYHNTSQDHLPQPSIHDDTRLDSSIDNFIEIHMQQYGSGGCVGGGQNPGKRGSVPPSHYQQNNNPYYERSQLLQPRHNHASVILQHNNRGSSGQGNIVIGYSPQKNYGQYEGLDKFEIIRTHGNALPALKGNNQQYQNIKITQESQSSRQVMPQKKFFQGQSLNYNQSTVRKDTDMIGNSQREGPKYQSIINDHNKKSMILGPSGGSMLIPSTHTISIQNPSSSSQISPIKLKSTLQYDSAAVPLSVQKPKMSESITSLSQQQKQHRSPQPQKTIIINNDNLKMHHQQQNIDMTSQTTIQVLKEPSSQYNSKNMRQHRRVTQVEITKGGLSVISQAGMNVGQITQLHPLYKY